MAREFFDRRTGGTGGCYLCSTVLLSKRSSTVLLSKRFIASPVAIRETQAFRRSTGRPLSRDGPQRPFMVLLFSCPPVLLSSCPKDLSLLLSLFAKRKRSAAQPAARSRWTARSGLLWFYCSPVQRIYRFSCSRQVRTRATSASVRPWCRGRQITVSAIFVATGKFSGRALGRPLYVLKWLIRG